MKIHELSPAENSKKNRKRIGRGNGSGHGGTSCKGHKGQNARAGGGVRPGFEGGQMPLHRRLPKHGFKNLFKTYYNIINISDLEGFESDSLIDIQALRRAGLVKNLKQGVKLLGNGDISVPVTILVNKISQSAIEKIKAAGGKVEII